MTDQIRHVARLPQRLLRERAMIAELAAKTVHVTIRDFKAKNAPPPQSLSISPVLSRHLRKDPQLGFREKPTFMGILIKVDENLREGEIRLSSVDTSRQLRYTASSIISPYLFSIFGNDCYNIVIKTRGHPVNFHSAGPEQTALEMLREMITEKEFFKYLKYGFLIVEGKSGKQYQVFRLNAHTKVWMRGKLVEEICVRINNKADVPPTDNVIAFKVMIESNEDEFRRIGNVYRMKVA